MLITTSVFGLWLGVVALGSLFKGDLMLGGSQLAVAFLFIIRFFWPWFLEGGRWSTAGQHAGPPPWHDR